MEMTCSHVLVVDDDLDMCNQLSDYLGRNDFRVTAVNTAKQMLDFIAREAVDLLLLEPRLRGEDGLRLTRAVRESSSLPIVVMSESDEVVDRVMGLELGADDYVTKPFSPRELLARIRAVLRRCKVDVAGPARGNAPRAYRFAGWELNVRLRRLTSPQSETIPITNSEFNLLVAFLAAPRRVLSREQLLDSSRLHNDEVFDRSVDVQVGRLRRKIEPKGSRTALIRTERGAGYVFAADVETVR